MNFFFHTIHSVLSLWSTTDLQYHTFIHGRLLTSELQPSQLKGDQAVTNLYQVNQSVQVVGGQNETIPGAEVAPAAQEEVSTQAMLQRASEMLIEDGIQIVVIRTCRVKRE